MAKLWDSKAYMKMLYVSQRKSPEEIAEKLGCSLQTVYRALHKHGLIRREKKNY